MTAGPAGLLIAAPASGSGKTTVTLALLRHLCRRGLRVASVKVGPDYIDPGFHAAASGRPCFNLDPWAMREETLAAVLAEAGRDSDLVIGEGVMGLFDGAALTDGAGLAAGSTAALAGVTGWPVILVIDCKGMGASVAALAQGFARFHKAVEVSAVILNSVASTRHEAMLRRACAEVGLPVLAALSRDAGLERPSRHLGLVQAEEDSGLEAFLDAAATVVAAQLDEGALIANARPARLKAEALIAPMAPLGQHIAVARDRAFAFSYPFTLEAWRRAGAEVSFFSPLADDAPAPIADAVYLPGGYPELHAGRLANNRCFHAGLKESVEAGAVVYGECGGYMVLGQGLEDAAGQRHEMLGLLPLESSMKRPQRHLGYRRAELLQDGPLGAAGLVYRGHEFHYATSSLSEADGSLFRSFDSTGQALGPTGQRRGRVMGSFLHLIDQEEPMAVAERTTERQSLRL